MFERTTYGPTGPLGPVRRLRVVLVVALAFGIAGLGSSALASELFEDPHGTLFSESAYPSAAECGQCHPKVYEEWASSNHAYSSMSPMFHKFEQKINDLAQGTIGYFCMRCHASVGTTIKESRDLALWERAQVSREGVTCVTCHRVDERYQKENGERRIVPGNIHQPVYGNYEAQELPKIVANPGAYNVRPSEDSSVRGTPIHAQAIEFEQLSSSQFCTSCHQVAVFPGIKLEVVVEQYRGSPAFREGITCQDCHMSQVQGLNSGYEMDYVAYIGGKPIGEKRKHSNHRFVGPGYPIAHPGIFPHNPRATEIADIQQWLQFDYKAGWGTEAFERSGPSESQFPPHWQDLERRLEAREVIEENLVELKVKRDLREEVMEAGSGVDGPFFTSKRKVGKALKFDFVLKNKNNGHNLPSGSLGAQPEIWFNVALSNPSGVTVWESGYVDSNGDMADLHSLDVAAGTIEHDDQLVNLQTKFLTTNVAGTDREMYLPVNIDIDQIPFIRPGNTPNSVMNHPPFIRMEGRSIPPLGERKISYRVPGDKITEAGTYKLSFRMRSRAEPIYFMRFVGATSEMEEAMNEWMLDYHKHAVEFEIE